MSDESAEARGAPINSSRKGKRLNSNRKGKRWEAKVHNMLAKVYGADAVVLGAQYVTDHHTVDRLTPDLCVECKSGSRINLIAALEQCERDAAPRRLHIGRICVVAAKYDRKPPVVAMRMDDFLRLMEERRWRAKNACE